MKRRKGWGVSVCVHALGYPLALLGSIGVVKVVLVLVLVLVESGNKYC